MEEMHKSCVFCKIILGNCAKTNLLYEDEVYVSFKDLRPASAHHYLIVPKRHVKSPSILSYQDNDMVKKLKEIGLKVLQEQNADLNDVRFGFHWPPFTSVQHLHMHAISPVSEMSFFSRIIFRPNSLWFTTVDALIEKLEKDAPI